VPHTTNQQSSRHFKQSKVGNNSLNRSSNPKNIAVTPPTTDKPATNIRGLPIPGSTTLQQPITLPAPPTQYHSSAVPLFQIRSSSMMEIVLSLLRQRANTPDKLPRQRVTLSSPLRKAIIQNPEVPKTSHSVMAIAENKYRELFNYSTRMIECHILHGKPFLTDEEIALVIAFTTYRIASTKKNHGQEVNDSWHNAEEAYGFKVSWYAYDKKATTYVCDFNNFLHC
jgi:hypothetical protein